MEEIKEDASTKERDLLANFIKDVHKSLRTEAAGSDNVEEIWKKHCENKELLQKYAQSMKSLATEHWTGNLAAAGDSRQDRNFWTQATITEYYFKGGLASQRDKERRKVENFIHYKMPDYEFHYPVLDEETFPELNVLDVGSCYNPLSCVPGFKVTAIDIAPGDSSVLECDFLSVTLSDNFSIEGTAVKKLPREHYHCVIFSLLLEYLPTKSQRLASCRKAYELLKSEGLLVIITPDSKHATANASMIKSWRLALALLGFSRVAYDKLKHIHCMAFRKTPVELGIWKKLSLSSLNRNREVENLDDLMYIPQERKAKD